MSDVAPIDPASPLPPPHSPQNVGGPPPSQPPGNMFSRLRENPEQGGPRMSFMDHLMELRKRLWISVVAIGICMTLAICLFDPIIYAMKGPIRQINADYAKRDDYQHVLKAVHLPPNAPALLDLSTLTPLESTMTIMWLGVYAGLAVSSPIILFQIWAFIAPGLKPKEQRAIQPMLLG